MRVNINKKSFHKSSASNLGSESSFEVSKSKLIVDSGSTYHTLIDKTWFKKSQKLETTINIPVGGEKLKE